MNTLRQNQSRLIHWAVLTFAPTKTYQAITFSSPELIEGITDTVFTGGSSTGAATDGLYADGDDTPGAQSASFTISGIATTVVSGGMRGRPSSEHGHPLKIAL
jgi:hypothetical protein